MRLVALLVILIGIMARCGNAGPDQKRSTTTFPPEITLRVNYYRQKCQGESTFDCLLVQEGKQVGTKNWELFYEGIHGFQYEPGYIYTLQVKVEEVYDPLMDGSSRRYSLVRTLSKEKVR